MSLIIARDFIYTATFDFYNAPEWANYATMDADETVCVHEMEPYVCGNFWQSSGKKSRLKDQGEIPIGVDWREMVIKRNEN